MYGAIEDVITTTNKDKPRKRDRVNAVLKGVLRKSERTIQRERQIHDFMFLADDNSNDFLPNQKSNLYVMLNPRSNGTQAVIFKWFIATVIIIDLVFFVMSTEPDLSEKNVELCYHIEGITSTIFLIEYAARLATVTESIKYKNMGPILGRLNYMMTIPALIDLIATVPFFLEFFIGFNLPTLTYLRAFRLLRILKTTGFSEATKAVYRVIYYNRQILYVALLICIGLVLVTAVLMYYFRPREDGHSQDFNSLASTMYLSTLMLTGQGGPEGDLPWYTKGVVLLTGVFSIGMFAIPASMLTWGFEAEAERVAKLTYNTKRRSRSSDYDTWSYSSEDYSSDEEYKKIITGANEEEDDISVEDEAARKAMVHMFDSSNEIPLSELMSSNYRSGREEASITSQSRLSALESKVEENSIKLDEILRMLNEMQGQNQNVEISSS